MSFILDALKKLEREKEARDPGMVMVGPVPWGGRDRRRGPGLAVIGAVLAVVLAGSFFWLRSGVGPSTVESEDEGPATPAAPAASGETTPVVPGSRTSGPPGAEPAPPPSRNLQLPGAGAAPSTAPAAPLAAGTDTTASQEPALLTSDEVETGVPVEDVKPVAPVEEARPPTRSSPAPEFRLTAISSRDGHPIALLNDRLVREGDRFGDVLILRIGESDIEIEVNGKRRTIRF